MGEETIKHILYLSYDGMTDPLGQSQVLPYLKGLTEKGYKFSLVSFEKEENSSNTPIIRDMLNSANILWFPKSYTKKPPVLSTVWDIIRMYRTAKGILKENPFQIMHCRSYITALIGLRFKRRFGVKFVFDMRGFWVDERVEGGIWNLENPFYNWIYKYFKKRESEFFEESDFIISLTEAAKNEINDKIATSIRSIEVIPCCVDSKLFDYNILKYTQIEEAKNHLSLNSESFIISYLGSIGTWYMLSEMLEFFKELLSDKPNAIFLFITSDSSNSILNKAAHLGIEINKIRVIKSTRKEVPVYLALSQVSLFFIKPVYSKMASSPTKLAEIMAMGIPVICNGNVGDLNSIVNENVGIITDQLNTKGYHQVIKMLPQILQKDKLAIRNQAIKLFSLEEGVSKYAKAYENLLQ